MACQTVVLIVAVAVVGVVVGVEVWATPARITREVDNAHGGFALSRDERLHTTSMQYAPRSTTMTTVLLVQKLVKN